VSAPLVTPQLRDWILEQARAGCRPETMLAAMRSSGWDDALAADAIEATLRAVLGDGAPAQALPLPVRVPAPDLSGSPSRLQAADREVAVLLALQQPRIVVFGGLLADAECDALVAAASPRLDRSETVDTATGGSGVHDARTSRGMFFGRGETALCARIESRIAALIDWPVDHGEGLQVLHYRPGAEYRPHYDYFDSGEPGMAAVLARGGQRVATLLMYLSTPLRGGATVFPDAGLEVTPIKGNAVFFSYDRPHPVSRSLHGGAPVLQGEKWVATKWLREGEFR
jgi:prolyl 4-hydroxylase